MTLHWSVLQQLLILAMICSTLSVAFIQKTKKLCPNHIFVLFYSFLVNLGIGVLFTQTFTDLSLYHSLWVGFFSYLGADTIYQSLEGKLASYSSLVGSSSSSKEETGVSSEVDEDILGEIPRD